MVWFAHRAVIPIIFMTVLSAVLSLQVFPVNADVITCNYNGDIQAYNCSQYPLLVGNIVSINGCTAKVTVQAIEGEQQAVTIRITAKAGDCGWDVGTDVDIQVARYTKCNCPLVGGEILPVPKLLLIAPYLVYAAGLVAATVLTTVLLRNRSKSRDTRDSKW